MGEEVGEAKTEVETLLVFLKKTKEGKYAKIELSSLGYARIREETVTVETFGDYYYGIS